MLRRPPGCKTQTHSSRKLRVDVSSNMSVPCGMLGHSRTFREGRFDPAGRVVTRRRGGDSDTSKGEPPGPRGSPLTRKGNLIGSQGTPSCQLAYPSVPDRSHRLPIEKTVAGAVGPGISQKEVTLMGQLLHPDALAERLQISTKTLSNWRSRRIGPAFVRLQGGVIRYRQEDIDAWLDDQAGTSRDWMAS